jgi:hypothetical protein
MKKIGDVVKFKYGPTGTTLVRATGFPTIRRGWPHGKHSDLTSELKSCILHPPPRGAWVVPSWNSCRTGGYRLRERS